MKNLLKGFFSLLLFFYFACAQADAINTLDTNALSNQLLAVKSQYNLEKEKDAKIQAQLAELKKRHEADLQYNLDSSVTLATVQEAQRNLMLAQSELEGIDIELASTRQAIDRYQDSVENVAEAIQMIRITAANQLNDNSLQKLEERKAILDDILSLERARINNLLNAKKLAQAIIKEDKYRYRILMGNLKKAKLMQKVTEQQQEQARLQTLHQQWLTQINELNFQLNAQVDAGAGNNILTPLQWKILCASEYANFYHTRLVLSRLQERSQQLEADMQTVLSIASINQLIRQAERDLRDVLNMQQLVQTKVTRLKSKNLWGVFAHEISETERNNIASDLVKQYASLDLQSHLLMTRLDQLKKQLDKMLHAELAMRQGVPGLDLDAWKQLASQLSRMPELAALMLKNLYEQTQDDLEQQDWQIWAFGGLVLLSLTMLLVLPRLLNRFTLSLQEHRKKWTLNIVYILSRLLRREVFVLTLLGFTFGTMTIAQMSFASFKTPIYLLIVFMIFSTAIGISRLALLETIDDVSGQDVSLYRWLKYVLTIGGIITAITVFVHQISVAYHIQDFCNRLFIVFLLIVALILLKNWRVAPKIALGYLVNARAYVQRIVYILSFLIPFMFLCDTIIALFGYVNFAVAISRYQGYFIAVLSGYLFLHGLLKELTEYLSELFIRYIPNGWLWTEAFLKPIDKIFRILLLISAGSFLFHAYGWNKNTPFIKKLTSAMNYSLFEFANTVFTAWSFIELVLAVIFLIWAGRWTREFCYRWIFSKTKDLGLRNSLAVLSQYLVVLLGILITLKLVGVDLTGIAVVLGGLAVGVGFGMRDLANNMVGGLILLLERPIRKGDTVTIDGYEGDVTDISMRSMVLNTWDHMEVVIPNADILNKPFTNWTHQDSIVRSVIPLRFAPDEDPHLIRDIIFDVLSKHREILKEPRPEVFLKELDQCLAEMEIRYYINLHISRSRPRVRSEVLFALQERFNEAGIKPPIPIHKVELGNKKDV